MTALTEKAKADVATAFDDRDRIAGGWQPPAELWADAPVLNRWCYTVHPRSGTMAVAGFVDGEQRRSAPVIVMETGPGGIGWARTLTGWIRLALTDDELHAPGRRILSEDARELELTAQLAGYVAPRRSLRPEGALVLDNGWAEVADHFDKTAQDPELALAVFYARLRKVSLRDAKLMIGGWWVARQMDFENV